jgi:4-amino-4-deoxy-L-arabinose transferase-like glycosyltransferase
LRGRQSPKGFPQARKRQKLTFVLVQARRGPLLACLAIIVLSLTISVWDLSENGFGNLYYAVAARSMSESWHNFFFASFDPSGFISVDKPPVFLWIDSLSVRQFGFSSWSLLLPTAIVGAAGAGVTWFIVWRYFGAVAATIAGLILALTPIVVAINRLNQPEPFYILALLGAAACTLVSLEQKRWWTWTVLAGVLVGVAFNIKMLAGWIPGPALALAIVVGVEGTWRSAWRDWLPRLVVLGAVTLAVSASWALVVDSSPADERPYVGGSTDNTVSDLVLGYNGFKRVEGDPTEPAPLPPHLVNPPEPNSASNNIGPGLLRMFDREHGGQIAWFLPFALVVGFVVLWHWRDDRLRRASVVLWLGWLLLYGLVFSFTRGTYHPYYTSALGPAIGALTGIGVVALGQLRRRHIGWLAVGAVLALLTLWVQIDVSGRQDGFYDWLRPVIAIAVVGGLVLAAASVWQHRVPLALGMAVALIGLLLMPAAWSLHETAFATSNPVSPRAGPRVVQEISPLRVPARESSTLEMVQWLLEHRQPGTLWDVVLTNAQDAAPLMLKYDLTVMALGGFRSSDPTLTPAQFADRVAAGEVRYVLVTGRIAAQAAALADNPDLPKAGVAAVWPAVVAACEPATDRIAPLRVVERGYIYDCAGHEAELASH